MVNGSLFRRVAVEILLRPPGGSQQIGNGQQFPGVEAAAPVRPVQDLRHRLDAGEGGATVEADHGPGGVGLVQQPQDLLGLRLRADPQGPLLGFGADSLVGQHLQHPGQLQGADGFVKQFAHSSFLFV